MKLGKMMTISKKRKLELLLMTQDRLSSLPDCILADILSNLRIEDAVATSVLSRSWHHLWKQTTHLCFPTLNFISGETFLNSLQRVDHILDQLTSLNIYSFYLKLEWPGHGSESILATRFESWCQQLCNRNVVEIELVVTFNLACPLPIQLPTCLLQSKSLASLKLSIGLCYESPKDGTIGFPYLKKLNIVLQDSNLHNMLGIFRSIPALEELTLTLRRVKDQCLEISAPVLKSLTILAYWGSKSSKVMIDTPKLEFLEIKPELLWYHFVQNPTQLQTAVISGHCAWRDGVEHHEKLGRLVSGITSVRALHLSTCLCLPVFNTTSTYGKDDGVGLAATFRNLSHLSMKCTWEKAKANWSGLLPTSVLSKLKRVEVILSCTAKEDDAIILLDYILTNSNLLEQLIVSALYGLVYGSDKIRFRCQENIFCKALFGLSRISSNCEVEFHGREISASSKAFNIVKPAS